MSINFKYDNLDELRTRLLSREQLRAVDKVVLSRGGLVWWKVGEGKSRIGLFTFAQMQTAFAWELPSICLVVCRRKAFRDWSEEIRRCFGEKTSIYEDQIPVLPPSNSPVFLLVSAALIDKFEGRRDIRMMILDETWMYANHKSKRSKAVCKLAKFRMTVGLSGTVMKNQDTFEMYAQLMAVNKQKILSKSPTSFRTEFQICDSFGGFPSFRPKPKSYGKILRIIDEVTDIHFPTNAARTIHEQYHNVEPTNQQLKIFKELKEFFAIEDFGLEYNSTLATIAKTQQVANGYVTTPNGIIHRIASNKPEKLRDELEDILVSGVDKAIVWCAFRHDVEMLKAYLPFASLQMLGGQEFDVDRWRSSDIRVCLATEASGSSVNHFYDTAYAIYFSSNFKWLDMQQSRGRTDRKSSSHQCCFYKYLQVLESLDSSIYKIAMESGERERRLIAHAEIEKWLEPKT
jgi:hypothetical protein